MAQTRLLYQRFGVCRQFADSCGQALAVNERLIKEDQQEYHDEMKANYRDLTRELSSIMHEQVGRERLHAPRENPTVVIAILGKT